MDLLIAKLQAEPLMLSSLFKPLVVLVVLIGWGWLAGRLDKDAGYYYLERNLWGMAHLGAGIVGFGVILFVPMFLIALPLGLLILAGEALGYVVYRNKQVPEAERWSGMDIVRKVQNEREQKAVERARVAATVMLFSKDEQQLDVPIGSDPRASAFGLFQDLVVFAVHRGSDRIEITVEPEKASFNARIDGIRYPQKAPDPALCVQLIDYLKENAGMDLNERRRKQTGQMWVEVEGHDRNTLDLTTAGSTRAFKLVIEIDAEGRNDKAIGELGLIDPAQMEKVKALATELSKVVIFSGPPKQGTTTTMYAMLKEHDPYTASVITYEEQTPFSVEGVSHNLFPEGASNEQIQDDFASKLRADPNVVLVSRVVSTDMVKLIAQSAEDTRFYLPLPGKDTMAVLKTWIKLVGDQRLAAESLGAIVNQRLVRKLCPVCRVSYKPDAAAIKKLNLGDAGVDTLYKASGKIMVKDEQVPCEMCHGIGYRGRVGVFEVMHIDREARSLIASGEGERLRAHLRKQRMAYLQEAALAKVVEGVCDIKEVTRVMSEAQKD